VSSLLGVLDGFFMELPSEFRVVAVSVPPVVVTAKLRRTSN
jgi:hypothetical protein